MAQAPCWLGTQPGPRRGRRAGRCGRHRCQSRAVRMSGPSSVMATVCSTWAPREPSEAADGPAVRVGEDLVGGVQEPRLDGDHQARLAAGSRGPARPSLGTCGSPCMVRPTPWPPNCRLTPSPPPRATAPIAAEMSPSRLPTTAAAMPASRARPAVVDQARGPPRAAVPTTRLIAESATQPSTLAAKSRLSRSPSRQRVVVGEPVQDRVVDRRAQHLAERRSRRTTGGSRCSRTPRRARGSCRARARRGRAG